MSKPYTAGVEVEYDGGDDDRPSSPNANNKTSKVDESIVCPPSFTQTISDSTENQAYYATIEEPKVDETNTITPIATATAEPTTVQDLGPRQGQKCCFCCCDYRRAVVIINIVIGVLEALLLIFVATGTLTLYLYDTGGTYVNTNYETTEMIFSGISIVLSGLAIFGAFTYNIILVGLNVLWLITAFVLGIFLGLQYCNDYCDAYTGGDYYYSSCTCYVNGGALIATGAVMCLFAYPHIGFIVQVRKGIMSRDTYRREQFSCCCVDQAV